jgi:hypothetical protein
MGAGTGVGGEKLTGEWLAMAEKLTRVALSGLKTGAAESGWQGQAGGINISLRYGLVITLMPVLLSCGFCVYIYVNTKTKRYENDDARKQKEGIWGCK